MNRRPTHKCHCGEHVWTALSRGFVTLASPEDQPLLTDYTWSSVVKGRATYVARYIRHPRRKVIYLHREMLPTSKWIDHKDGNPLNNQRDNLRECSPLENARNARRRRDAKHKFKGVKKPKGRTRWHAHIKLEKRVVFLGSFATELEALEVYESAARRNFGKFWRPQCA